MVRVRPRTWFRSTALVTLALLMLAATVQAAQPTSSMKTGDTVSVEGLSRKPLSFNVDDSDNTKRQSDATTLIYSNNPETLSSSYMDGSGETAADLMHATLGPGRYRIFAGHTNWWVGFDLDVAVMIRAHNKKSSILVGKAGHQISHINGDWKSTTNPDFQTGGLLAAQNYWNSTASIQRREVSTEWSVLDGPYTITHDGAANVNLFYEFVVLPGSEMELAVTAGKTGSDLAARWQAGKVTVAPKRSPDSPAWGGPESHGEAGLFYGEKYVNIKVNVDKDLANSTVALVDKVGHYFTTQKDPASDDGDQDGWMKAAGPSLYPEAPYLPGNYGAVYHYKVKLTGSENKKAMVLLGLIGDQVDQPVGLVTSVDGHPAQLLGPQDLGCDECGSRQYAWYVGSAAGGETLNFDVIVPGNVNLPYQLFIKPAQ